MQLRQDLTTSLASLFNNDTKHVAQLYWGIPNGTARHVY